MVILTASLRCRRQLLALCAALLSNGIATAADSAVVFADVVVSGGSFGAPAAAIAAARANPAATVLLIEPTDWLGGQATSQGVAAIDNAWHQPGQSLMINNPEKYYAADYLQFLDEMRTAPASAPGEGLAPNGTSWVSREAFDPRTGAWALDKMVADYPNITVIKMAVVKDVTAIDATDAHGPAREITSLSLVMRTPQPGYEPFSRFLSAELPDWFSPSDSADFAKTLISVEPADPARGLVVIDASETADAIVLSGADYVVGREKTTEAVSPTGALPEHNESSSQATVFPFCITDAPAPDAETALKTPWADFDSYYQNRKTNYFRLGSFSWTRVWSYRRLKTTGPMFRFDNAYQGDVTMQNWNPGNDYPDASIYLPKTAAAAQATDWAGGLNLVAIAGAEKLARAFYFYMKDLNPQPWDTRYLHGDDPLNMMDTEHGLAKFPYIRCGRRIIGLENFRLLQRYLFPATTGANARSSFRFYDSVGIGNYAMDAHPVAGSSGVGHSTETPAPFYLPYRAIASSNVRNLLAGNKNFAGTYWTNSAYRLHPIEWAVGSAAGVVAAHMHRDSRTNLQMLELPNLRQMQADIAANSPIHWEAYDPAPVPAKDGDLIVNDLKSVAYQQPFPIQIYSFGAARAEVYKNGQLVGETTTRVNDHLLFSNAVATTNPLHVQVRCFTTTGSLLAVLDATVAVTNVPDDPYIVDNADPRFSVQGSWTVGTAQADKYATSYHYASGTGGLKRATWTLGLPSAGFHEVFTWYPASSNRAIDAPFTIFLSGFL